MHLSLSASVKKAVYKEAFRIGKINVVFAQMVHLQKKLSGKEKGQTIFR
jgi:hypothetical protein